MRLYDAHSHLQDERIYGYLKSVFSCYQQGKIETVIVNGTSPSDWHRVEILAAEYNCIRPAFGLHPWFIEAVDPNWFEVLKTFLIRNRGASIGEIGLDKSSHAPELKLQQQVFTQQLELAVSMKLTPCLHCVRTWGHMLEILKHFGKDLSGFLLHSFSGPLEMIEQLVDLGAYFSISGYHMKKRRSDPFDIWKQIPIERILIESDAPNMPPPDELREYEWKGIDGGNLHLNHPGNLISVYKWAANGLTIDLQTFTQQMESNFQRLFPPVY